MRVTTPAPNLVSIYVVQKRRPWYAASAQHVLFWVILVGSIGISRMWFGGAFIIDVIAGVVAMLSVARFAVTDPTRKFEMEPDEVRRWLIDGAPKDVREWRSIRLRKSRATPVTQDNATK